MGALEISSSGPQFGCTSFGFKVTTIFTERLRLPLPRLSQIDMNSLKVIKFFIMDYLVLECGAKYGMIQEAGHVDAHG